MTDSSMINIGGKNSENDQFYRYKRNKLEVQQVHNTTVVVNLGVVISQLNANPEELKRFLQKAIAVPSSGNVFKGKISVEDIEKQLDKPEIILWVYSPFRIGLEKSLYISDN